VLAPYAYIRAYQLQRRLQGFTFSYPDTMFLLGLATGLLILPLALGVFIVFALVAQRRAALKNLRSTIETLMRDSWRHDYVLRGRDKSGVVMLLEARSASDGRTYICALFPTNGWREAYVAGLRDFLRAKGLHFQEEEMALRQKDRKAWGEKQLGPSLSVLAVDLNNDAHAAHEAVRAVMDEVFEIGRRGRWLQERKQKRGRKPGFDHSGG
jgi:hypothetical protein